MFSMNFWNYPLAKEHPRDNSTPFRNLTLFPTSLYVAIVASFKSFFYLSSTTRGGGGISQS